MGNAQQPFSDYFARLKSPDVNVSRAALISLEKEARHRLSLGSGSNDIWFLGAGATLSRAPLHSNPQLQIEVLLLIVQWAYKEGRPQDAIPFAGAALDFATVANAPSLLRRAWSHMGLLHFALRSFSDATISFAKALEIADTLGDRVGKCSAIANLAAARLEAGLIDESVKLNKYVIDLGSGEEHLRSLVTEAHHNIALASILVGDVKSAVQHMNEAIQHLREPNNGFVGLGRVMMEFTFTKILVRANELGLARERMRLAADFAELVKSAPAHRHAELARALCDAASGQTDIALTRLAGIEKEIAITDFAFRDFLEVELLCNRLAGKEQYARHYNRKYLSNLAQFQRAVANGEIARIKQSMYRRSQGDFRAQLEALIILTELREEPTGEHSLRVGRISRRLALAAGHSRDVVDRVETAARLHDIGKIAIPDAILLKRDELSDTEMDIVRRHTVEGCQVLSELLATAEAIPHAAIADIEVLRLAADIALHHHERWDGGGYPRRLAGNSIPELAQIVALADALDELTHVRPYKEPLSMGEALRRIEASSGKQFDPALVGLLPKIIDEPISGSPDFLGPPLEEAIPFVVANRVISRIAGTVLNGRGSEEQLV